MPMKLSRVDLYEIYDDLNKKHFGGKLPRYRIIWNTGFKNTIAQATHSDSLIELAYEHHRRRNNKEIIDSILHEMTHIWKRLYGSKGNYHTHDKQFKRKAKKLGLKYY